MVSELDSRITSQLALHRGLHSLAGPLIAMLRERLLREKLQQEVEKQPISLELVHGLEGVNRYCELAEQIKLDERAW